MINNAPDLNFLGSDWTLFVEWLKDQQQDTYKRLIDIKLSDDATQRLRGRALFIEQLLDLHNTAA